MVLRFDDDAYFSDVIGGKLLAAQGAKARTSIQIASMDGTNTSWTALTEPCLLLVSRGKTVRVSGTELDELILACHEDTEFAVGSGEPCGCSRS